MRIIFIYILTVGITLGEVVGEINIGATFKSALNVLDKAKIKKVNPGLAIVPSKEGAVFNYFKLNDKDMIMVSVFKGKVDNIWVLYKNKNGERYNRYTIRDVREVSFFGDDVLLRLARKTNIE